MAVIFNSAGTVIRHHLPMVSKALGAAKGDRGLIQLVHVNVEGRIMELIQNPDSTDVSDLQTVTSMLPTIEDEVMKGSTGEEGEVKLDLAELDKACENVALMIQYIDSYEGFIRHCVEEIGRARAYREAEAGKEEGGEEGEVLPRVTQLGEVAMELSAVLGGGESALLLSTISWTLRGELSYAEYEGEGKAACSNLVEEMFYVTQRAALRAIASGHVTTICVILNQCANTLSMVIPKVKTKDIP